MGDCLCQFMCSLWDVFHPAVGMGMPAWEQLLLCYRGNKRNVADIKKKKKEAIPTGLCLCLYLCVFVREKVCDF